MTSALTRNTENMALRKRSLEDVWFIFSSSLKKFLERSASEFSVCLMDFIRRFLYHISDPISISVIFFFKLQVLILLSVKTPGGF